MRERSRRQVGGRAFDQSWIRARRPRPDPVLRSDPPSTLVQEPFPVTGPASRGTERGTRAPSRLTGTQGAVGAVLVVLALGLALRLIIAYLFPGSGFGVDLNAFRFWAGNLAVAGTARLLRPGLLPRLHAGIPVRPVAARPHRQRHRRRRRRADQDPGDPRRPGHRLAGLVDDPRARRTAQPRARRPPSSPSSTRSAGSTRSSGARSTRSASSSCCSGCASCGAIVPNGPRSSRSSPP